MRWRVALDRQQERTHDLALRVRDWYNDNDHATYDYDHVANNYYNHAGRHDHDDGAGNDHNDTPGWDDYNDRAYYIDHRGRLYHYDDAGRRIYYDYGRFVR